MTLLDRRTFLGWGRLADRERQLLRVPILPLYHNVLSYLQKRYAPGWEPRRIRFKYVGIDSNWRPE
jgi:hypothetical protein